VRFPPFSLRPSALLTMNDLSIGTTLRSRSLEYQTDLLQEFSKKALDKVFSKCGGGDGLDLVIHKVHFPLLLLRLSHSLIGEPDLRTAHRHPH
jgi:hypothetical protein